MIDNMNNRHKSDNFILSAAIISAGGLIAKVIGAVYRIPLTNLLGSYGMGLYQLVFPPYILILVLATFGIPMALSRLLSEQYALLKYDNAQKLFRQARLLLFFTGLAGSLLLFFCSTALARAQGSPEIAAAYKIISPAILFVCVTGAFRGYFQGNMKMLPVSLSQVLEQVLKLIVGLSVARAFMPDTIKAVCGAALALTVSEGFSLVIMSVSYLIHKKYRPCVCRQSEQNFLPTIFMLALPLAISGIIMQCSQLLDSVMVVNLLRLPNATSAYGIWTGPVNSLLGFPVTLSSGVAISALPALTRTAVKGKKLQEKYNSAVKLTLIVALPSAIGLMTLAQPIMNLLYKGLPADEIEQAAKLMVVSGLSVVFLSLTQTMFSALQAMKKPYVGVISLGIGVAVKFAANAILLPIPSVNIYGAAISETLCYLFAVTAASLYLKYSAKLYLDTLNTLIKPIACCSIMLTGLIALTLFAKDFLMSGAGTLIAIALCVLLYGASVVAFKIFDKEEISISRKEKKDGARAEAGNTVN